ncbi:MAG: SpoIIE family protein phosphatase [Fretibacterium sp.]|nr:SpoIIE family protein phosphatase [Fretibacterium sp.]
MAVMILKMSAVTALYVLLTWSLWMLLRSCRLSRGQKIYVGVIYGLCSVLSTHFGVDYIHMMLNVRDIGPLAAGLFFDPLSGIIAGLIGGIERYIAGTYWGIGSYTRIACGVSTCLAGFLAAFLNVFIFKGKRPSTTYGFFMGAVMEVFHMYVVLITHQDDMNMAFFVVYSCSGPMIIFTGMGMAISSIVIKICEGEWKTPFRRLKAEKIHVLERFQSWLFFVTVTMLLINFLFSFAMQTHTATQHAHDTLESSSRNIRRAYNSIYYAQGEFNALGKVGVISKRTVSLAHGALNNALSAFQVSNEGIFDLFTSSGDVIAGKHEGAALAEGDLAFLQEQPFKVIFNARLFGMDSLCRLEKLVGSVTLLTLMPLSEIYAYRSVRGYENAFEDILLFTVLYVLIDLLVQRMVVNNLSRVNESLARITSGNLNEVVAVRNSVEFAALSDGINQTVNTLKGYIEAAEHSIEQELEYARIIQSAALPRNFSFPRSDFDLYATMDSAREVGGDFYDFFFVNHDKLVLLIADVSGKGVPAALFMMRSKTALRSLAEAGNSPAEILFKANNALCEGNDAEIFVTAWVGIVHLETGLMECANAGHEYPMLMRAGGNYRLMRDNHGLPLAGIENQRFEEYKVRLRPGDRLFVYTDGIPEAQNEQEEQYGTDRLLKVLTHLKDVPMRDVLPEVRRDIRNFVGAADQFDDITMLGFGLRKTEPFTSGSCRCERDRQEL